MLSRIAESMFWIGRYVERAEDTARILDVQTQLMLEDATIDEESTCRTLLSIMGVDSEPGDVVVHHVMTLHGAPGNAHSDRRRRGLATRWCGDDAVYDPRRADNEEQSARLAEAHRRGAFTEDALTEDDALAAADQEGEKA